MEGLSDPSDARILEASLGRMEGVRHGLLLIMVNSQVNLEYNSASVSLADIRQNHCRQRLRRFERVAAFASTQDMEVARLRKLLLIGVVFTVPAVLLSYPEIFSFLPLSGNQSLLRTPRLRLHL